MVSCGLILWNEEACGLIRCHLVTFDVMWFYVVVTWGHFVSCCVTLGWLRSCGCAKKTVSGWGQEQDLEREQEMWNHHIYVSTPRPGCVASNIATNLILKHSDSTLLSKFAVQSNTVYSVVQCKDGLIYSVMHLTPSAICSDEYTVLYSAVYSAMYCTVHKAMYI